MSKRTKHFLIVIGTQSLCLAVGLWMYHHLAVASADHRVRGRMWSDMEGGLSEAIRELDGVTFDDVTPASPEYLRLARILGSIHPSVSRTMLVDADWYPVVYGLSQTDEAPGGRDPGSALNVTDSIRWRLAANPASGTVGNLRGTVSLGSAEYLATARPLGGGHIVGYRPLADVATQLAVFTEDLVQVSVITLFWTCALLGVGVYLILVRLHDNLEDQRIQSYSGAFHQTQTLLRTRDSVIFGLAKLADSRDPETGDHLERISEYSTLLASALRRHPKYGSRVTPTFVRLIGISAALHDIGKVGIEDRILLKPGPLTDDERLEMQKHCAIGGECLQGIERRLGSSNFLQMAREIAFAHHEKWNGKGYPKGLSGEQIPLCARIVAIADVYDALSSKRVYKDAMPHQKCVEIIRADAGTHFDAELVDVWLTIEKRFRTIAQQYTSDPSKRRPAKPVEPAFMRKPLPLEDSVLEADVPV